MVNPNCSIARILCTAVDSKIFPSIPSFSKVVREMGISPQLTQDFNSTQNDKDLIETQNVQDFNSNKKISKIPDYAKDYKMNIFS